MFNCPHKYSFTYSLSEKSRNWVNITSSPRKENESYFRWSRLSPSWALHLWVWEHQEWVFAGPKDWQRPDVDRLEPERKEFPPTKQYWLGFQRPPPDWPLINRGVSLRGLRGVIHRRLRREFASNVPSQVFEFAVERCVFIFWTVLEHFWSHFVAILDWFLSFEFRPFLTNFNNFFSKFPISLTLRIAIIWQLANNLQSLMIAFSSNISSPLLSSANPLK